MSSVYIWRNALSLYHWGRHFFVTYTYKSPGIIYGGFQSLQKSCPGLPYLRYTNENSIKVIVYQILRCKLLWWISPSWTILPLQSQSTPEALWPSISADSDLGSNWRLLLYEVLLSYKCHFISLKAVWMQPDFGIFSGLLFLPPPLKKKNNLWRNSWIPSKNERFLTEYNFLIFLYILLN